MANSAINISANAQEVINLRKRIDELKAALSSMRRSTDPAAYDKLNRELQTSSIRYNRLVGDIQRYVVAQQQAERATSKSSDSLTDLLKKGAALAGVTFGAEKIRELGMEIVRVHGEMQQLNIAFSTMLKSQEKADALMSGLKTFATDTPFGLMDSAKGAKQLLAYGTQAENIIGDLKMLGNVASGVSAPLGDIVYLYGTLRSQGRAYAVDIRQFAGRGIPIYAELAKVLKVNIDQVNDLVSAGKVGFPEVEQAFKNMTSGGGMFEGLMEKQTASVTGQIEKLKDNIQFMFDAIGTSSEGAIYGAIDGASTLVENYQAVGEALTALIATYGTYKAATILNTAIDKTVTVMRYEAEIGELTKLLPLKEQEANADLKSAVASGRLTEEKAKQLIAIRAEIQSKLDVVKANNATAVSELQAVTASHKSVLQRSLASKRLVIQRQTELALAASSGNAAQYEAAKKALLEAQEERSYNVRMRKASADTLALAQSRARSTAVAVETMQTSINTATQNANTVSTNMLSVAKNRLSLAVGKVTTAMASNPMTLLAASAVALGFVVYKLVTATTIQEKAQIALNKALDDAKKKKDDLSNTTNSLVQVVNDSTKTTFDQISAYKDLQGLYPNLLKNMDIQAFKALGATEQQKLLNAAMSEFDISNQDVQLAKYEQLLDSLTQNIGKGASAFGKYEKEAEKLLGMDGFWDSRFNDEFDVKRVLEQTIIKLKEEQKQRQENLKEAELQAKPEAERRKILEDQLEVLKSQESSLTESILKTGEYKRNLDGTISPLSDAEKKFESISDLLNNWNKNPFAIKNVFESANPVLNDLLIKMRLLNEEKQKLTGQLAAPIVTAVNKATLDEQVKDFKEYEEGLAPDILKKLRSGKSIVTIGLSKERLSELQDIQDKYKKLGDAAKKAKEDLKIYEDPDKAAKRQDKLNNAAETAAEKRFEAQRKIDEADRQRQSEKLAFDNEMRQKSIENMEDGFDKQSALLKLNYDKDIQAIEEYKDKMSKAQYTEAKNQYTSKHGDDKGFEGYFSSLKGEDLSKIMPSGLRPEDITANVNAYTKAANDALNKGGRDINKNIALIMQEERLAFASELDQRLASVRAHFKDQKKDVENGSKDWIELNNLENQAIETVKAEHNTKLIQMDNEYKEKAIEISTDLFFFQSDKDAALLKQKIANNDKYINALKKEFTVQTKLDYDTLDEDVIDNLAKQYPDIVYAIRRAKQEQNGFNKEIAKTPAQKLKELKSLFDDISGVVGDITGVDFSMISNAIGGIASFAEKDYIAAASSGIGILSTAISGMVSQSAKHAAIQAEIVKLQQQYNIDLRQQNFDLVESINYARAFRQNLEALNWLVEKGFISDVDYSAWDALNEQYKIAQDNFEKASKSYEDYIKGSEDWLKSIDNEAYLRYNKDAKGILKDWKNGVIDTEEAIKRMAETTNIGDLRDQINSAKEETDKWKDEIVDLSKQMDEFATGTEFDSFLSDAMSAMQDMKSGVADLADFTEDSLKNAVLSSFKYKVLSNALEPMYNQLADLFLADTLDKDAVSKWGVDLESLLGEYADKLEEVYKSLGLDFTNSSTSQSASSGYSTSMSQDTGEAIGGRMTAMQMNLISIDGNVARIAEWSQPFDMKYNVDVLTAPLSALSESCQRIELMLEQNRNIAIQSYYELKDINKQTKELYPIRTGIDTMNKTLSNL